MHRHLASAASLVLLATACSDTAPSTTGPGPERLAWLRVEGGGQVVIVGRTVDPAVLALKVPVGPQIVRLTFLDEAGRPARLPDSAAVYPTLEPLDPALLASDRTGPWQFHLHGRVAVPTTLVAHLRLVASDSAIAGPFEVPVLVVGSGGSD